MQILFFFSFFFFLLIIIESGLLVGIRWSVCTLKSHRSLCVSFSRTDAGLCIHHLLVWSNLNFLHISQWITLPTQSCLAFYSFCANLLHSLIMWLIVSSLSPHSLHLMFCCVLSILALVWLVLMALFCAAIKRDSVSLLRFLFLSQVQVFWCEILFISGHRVGFFSPIFVSQLLSFYRLSCCQYRFWWLSSVLVRVFLCSLRAVVSMRQRCLRCWQVLFLPLFYIHIVCRHRLWDVMPYAWSLVFFFFDPFV